MSAWSKLSRAMKNIFFMLMVSSCLLHAHDHIEVGLVPGEESFLALDGPDFQLALYVPPGEPFSGYLSQFPGGWHACELTFTTELNALEPAEQADPRIEMVSVSGPPGGSFGFWEVGALEPTILLPVGWAESDASFPVVFAGDTHAHGRCFTMDKPGIYTVTFRAVDSADLFEPSANKTITSTPCRPRNCLSVWRAGACHFHLPVARTSITTCKCARTLPPVAGSMSSRTFPSTGTAAGSK